MLISDFWYCIVVFIFLFYRWFRSNVALDFNLGVPIMFGTWPTSLEIRPNQSLWSSYFPRRNNTKSCSHVYADFFLKKVLTLGLTIQNKCFFGTGFQCRNSIFSFGFSPAEFAFVGCGPYLSVWQPILLTKFLRRNTMYN